MHKKRSAMGIGVATLVTIIVVLLLTAFAVLSLVSALSSLKLSEMAVAQGERYYAADTQATLWYAELDNFVAELKGEPESFAQQLESAGYEAVVISEGETRIIRGFTMSEYRSLMVTIAVHDDKTTTIRQWQS